LYLYIFKQGINCFVEKKPKTLRLINEEANILVRVSNESSQQIESKSLSFETENYADFFFSFAFVTFVESKSIFRQISISEKCILPSY